MMINNYVPTHLHSTYSINDSTTDPEDYINKAKEFGMKAIAFTEHGNAYNWIKKKQLCDKAGIKFLFGVEVYLTKSHEVKERDNYHTIMIAKNHDGIKEILNLLSISTDKEHQYYKNRLSFEEFCNSSRNIITTSACLGSPLAHLDRSDEWFDKLMERYDYLEIQPHSEARQIKYNQYICELASEYNKPIISGADTHEINEYKSECRKIILRSMQGDKYLDDMENFDLTFKSFDELVAMYRKQGVLDEETYMTAINNTNVLADIVEDFELDYTFKYPDIFKDPIPTMISRCYDRLNYLIDTNIIKDEDFMRYSDRIDSEVNVFDKLNMGSFMLYFGQLIGWCKDNNIEVGPGRGSVTGSLVAYLLGITEVDPIVWGTNFVRFCNVNRYSLGDIDCDFPPADRPRVYKYIREQFGDTNSAYIVTFQKLKVKSIIDSVGRALKMDVAETERIKAGYNDIEREEKSIHKQLENNRISEKEHEELMKEIDRKTYEYMSKFENIFYYFKGLNGAIASTGFHACFTGDTLVTTIDGYKAIKDICVGDMVLTHSNRFMPVLDVMHRKSDGDRINIKIRQDIIKTTKNHPFLCKKSQGEKAEWLPASEIDDMYVAKPLSYNSKELEWNGVHVKVNQFKTKKEHKLTHKIIFTEDFMRFCGRFIGDGWVQYHPKRAIVSICCSFDECDEVENILDKLMYGYRKDKKQTVMRYTINNRELTEFMKQFGRGAKNKCLPSWIFGLNIKLKKALFDGYISADGYIHKNRITWNSVSKKLILGMSLIAQEIYLNPVSIVKSRDDGSMSIQGRICNVSARYDASISTDVSRFSFVEDNNIWMKAEVIDSNFEDDDVYNLSVLTDNSYCVNDIIVHNCGIIGSPINVVETIGVRYNKDKDIFIAQCDMKNVDSVNYVKYDILSLKTMQVLRDTFRFAGLDYPDLDKINWKDEAVFRDMMTSPVGLFQMEADSAFQYLCKFNTSSVQDIALVNALIRPSCASFREQAIQKILNKNPTEEIDNLLDDTYGYLIYQEQIILFLQKICGFTEAESDIIRRAIGKKSKALLDEWMPKIEEGYIKMSSKSEDEARKEFEIFSHILINASDYGFSYNHSIAYSMITYLTAYARYYYPKEFIASYLNNASNDDDIKDGIRLAELKGVDVVSPKYGISRGDYIIKNDKVYKGLESVLNVSNIVGEDLYAYSQQNAPNDFLELLDGILALPSTNKTNIETLIKIDFFSEFGSGKKLLKIYELYRELNDRKVLDKEKISSGIKKIIIRKLKDNEAGFTATAKQYKIVGRKLLEELWRLLPNEEFSILERVTHQLSYLNYIQDRDLIKLKIGLVKFKSKYDSWCIKIGDSDLWYKNMSGTEINRNDLILIDNDTEYKDKKGRMQRILYDVKVITLDRKKRSKE